MASTHVPLVWLGLSLAEWSNLASIVGVLVAVLALLKGLQEYISQGKIKEAEFFLKLDQELDNNDELRGVAEAIRNNDTKRMQEITPFGLRKLAAFYETVGLLWENDILSTHVAYAVFGVGVIQCMESDYVWLGDDRRNEYWETLNKFYTAMSSERKRLMKE
jgi:hypothetical protein